MTTQDLMLYKLELNDSTLAKKLIKEKYSVYSIEEEIDCSDKNVVAIISRTNNPTRIDTLKKVINKFQSTDSETNLFCVFIVTPEFCKNFYEEQLATEISSKKITMIYYKAGFAVEKRADRIPYIKNKTYRNKVHMMHVGDARNAVLALGCAIKAKHMIMSDDDRVNISPHFMEEKEGRWHWIEDAEFMKFNGAAKSALIKHINNVFSNTVTTSINPMKTNVALIGFTSQDRNRFIWQDYKGIKHHEINNLFKGYTGTIGKNSGKCTQCAQFVALNFDVLRNHDVIYQPLRMGEDNLFQFHLFQAGLLCLESAHLSHSSPKLEILPSECRNKTNADIKNYLPSEIKIILSLITDKVVTCDLSKTSENELWLDICWMKGGNKHRCLNFEREKIVKAEEKAKIKATKLKKKTEEWNKNIAKLKAQWKIWEAEDKPLYLAELSLLSKVTRKAVNELQKAFPIPKDPRIRYYKLDPYSEEFNSSLLLNEYVNIYAKEESDVEEEEIENAGFQNLGELFFQLWKAKIINIVDSQGTIIPDMKALGYFYRAKPSAK